MRSVPLTWYRERWPREVTADQLAALMQLLASTAGEPVILEISGRAGIVAHRLAVPSGRAGHVASQLRSAIPGLVLEAEPGPQTPAVDRAVALRLSTRLRPLRHDDPMTVSRAVLTALSHVGKDEALVLRIVLGRRLHPAVVPSQLDHKPSDSWLLDLLSGAFGPRRAVDTEVRNALRAKREEPGWRAVGLVGVAARDRSRQRQLIRQVLGALGGAEAPGVGFYVVSANPRRLASTQLPWRLPLRLNTSDLAAVAGVPVGPTSTLPVDSFRSRAFPPPSSVSSSGRLIGTSTYPGKARPLALSVRDSTRATHILGPSGSGKTTLITSLVAQDMAAGRSVVVVDSKGDLCDSILELVPPERIDDVVLIDPVDTSRPVVGLNPVAQAGRSPELAADQLLGLIHSNFPDLGVRTQDVIHASLLSLCRFPQATMASLPLLLTNAQFRRRVLAGIDDPVFLEPFWAAFDALSETGRAEVVAPVMNKIRPLLRPQLRSILGQSEPRFEMRQIFTQRKIVLVNLAKGLLGPESAAWLGSLFVASLWQTILGRAGVDPTRRHLTTIFLDEFQDYTRLPLDFADALAQGRSFGIGFVLAHQYLDQLDRPTRSALLANAQSKICFRLPPTDARVMVTPDGPDAEDFQNLGAYEAYAQLVAADAVQPWCSIRTLLPGKALSDPKLIRNRSAALYGRDRAEVEAALRSGLVGGRHRGGGDLAPRRLGNGGSA